jgi:hypothetical protein
VPIGSTVVPYVLVEALRDWKAKHCVRTPS